MPQVDVRIYREADGSVPLRTWLASLDRKSQDRCLAMIELLGEEGHALRRPYCENLGRGIYELRVKSGRVNLRMLYGFHEREAVVLNHGFSKGRQDPAPGDRPGRVAHGEVPGRPWTPHVPGGRMNMAPRVRSKGLQALVDEFIGDDPERVASFEKARADLAVGVALNRLRTEAGLTVRALAERVGTQPSVISRLESAEYEGHSLSMLRRVAAAMGRRVEVTFPPAAGPPAPTAAAERTARTFATQREATAAARTAAAADLRVGSKARREKDTIAPEATPPPSGRTDQSKAGKSTSRGTGKVTSGGPDTPPKA